MKFGTSFIIFLLFFSIALVEAVQSQNWLLAGLFMAVGLMSLYADNPKKKS